MARPSEDRLETLEAMFDSTNGLLTLKGSLVGLRRRLDALFREWAHVVEAEEFAFPPVMSVAALAAADYFSSFPHLATLATRIGPDDQGVARFVAAAKGSPLDRIEKDHLAPAKFVLPSAACYAVYQHFQGMQLREDRYVTLMSPCFRHETSYTAGQRQWSFHMREIVCVGSEAAVRRFLEKYRTLVQQKMEEARMPFTISEATDPFFDKRDPRRLLQRLEPLKHEFLFESSLAIASINFHRNFFGERFALRTAEGEPAYSGCVAFGLERWLYACTKMFGADGNAWPACLKPTTHDVG